MAKQPKLMDFSKMRNIIEPHLEKIRRNLYLNNELGIVYGNPDIFRLAVQQEPPFLINDYRMGIIMRGELRANFNLVEKQLTKGTIAFLGPGTIASPISFSDDLLIYGVVLFNDFPMPFPAGQIPSAFNGQVRDFQLRIGERDIRTTRSIIDALWQTIRQREYHRPTASALVAALMHHYDGLYHRYQSVLQHSQSRGQTLFDRFIYLVSQHCRREHRIGFYAEKMCLTERYLGTVVRQTSGTTAKEWLDRAIVTQIKVELRHTDKPVWLIAEEMNFANPAFFCKYFKRLTGMTPNGFRS